MAWFASAPSSAILSSARPRRAAAALLLLLAAIPVSARAAAGIAAGSAEIVAAQGTVEVRRGEAGAWEPVAAGARLGPGDLVRVGDPGRVVVALPDGNVLRLERRTTLLLGPPVRPRSFLVRLLSGALYFLAPVPGDIEISTPFVNALVEGTEFLARVGEDGATVSVVAGKVAVANEAGSVEVGSWQAASAGRGAPPTLRPELRVRDAVQWTLFYPPLLGGGPRDLPVMGDAVLGPAVREAVAALARGNIDRAAAVLATVPEQTGGSDLSAVRAAVALASGAAADARVHLQRAIERDPAHAPSRALLAAVAIAANDVGTALREARAAVDAAPASVPARLALAYALQAALDLDGAREQVRLALESDPANPLVLARAAELELVRGDPDEAAAAAARAVRAGPDLERPWTALGYALLGRLDTAGARRAFETAAALDPFAPLPRLGLGLAMNRVGDLAAGRRQLTLAAALDPGSATVRSYLGKAFHAERRGGLAARELAVARELDPGDPTPWLYDAIRAADANRPAEALLHLQASLERNDHRAVYRSRLLLDDDRAARSAGLGRLYRELGFEQLALSSGARSVAVNPAEPAVHAILAEGYRALPRHETARASELLQYRLLQPVSVVPVPTALAEAGRGILEGAGPAEVGYGEYTPLFVSDGVRLRGDALYGSNGTLGVEAAAGGIAGRWSWGGAGYDFRTDGPRENADQHLSLADVFLQYRPSWRTSVQLEAASTRRELGDPVQRFDPGGSAAAPEPQSRSRQEERASSLRLGLRRVLSPQSDLLVSVVGTGLHQEGVPLPGDLIDVRLEGVLAEVQHLHRWARGGNLAAGAGYVGARRSESVIYGGEDFGEGSGTVRQLNAYLYPTIAVTPRLSVTAGASWDSLDGESLDARRLSPKLGLLWEAGPRTTIRAAYFQTLNRTLLSRQTLEPTAVAGFNQLYDEAEGTRAARSGVGVDRRFGDRLFGGAELSRRSLEVPWFGEEENGTAAWDEQLQRLYLSWVPAPWLALGVEYQRDRLERSADFVGPELFTGLRTTRIPVSAGVYGSGGLSTRVTATWVGQEGDFGDPLGEGTIRGSDGFWLFDAALRWLAPGGGGALSLEVRNLLDAGFSYQDPDPAAPRIAPGRRFFARVALSF